MISLIDCRASAACLSNLREHGFETILMPPSRCLQTGVSSHTDMLLFIGFGKLFCHARYYEDNKELIDNIADFASLELILSQEAWATDYPHDVLFNACVVGNLLICNKKTVSKLILDAAEEHNFNVITVSQGYTKCSVCVVSDNAIITSDKTIARACDKANVDVLTVSEGHVSLPPYEFGFIGGASGLCDDKVYFFGSLNNHPDAISIIDFCRAHGKDVVSLGDHGLLDVGTIFFI